MADDFDESLDIGRKTRLAGLPGKIDINDPLSVDESPNYQISFGRPSCDPAAVPLLLVRAIVHNVGAPSFARMPINFCGLDEV